MLLIIKNNVKQSINNIINIIKKDFKNIKINLINSNNNIILEVTILKQQDANLFYRYNFIEKIIDLKNPYPLVANNKKKNIKIGNVTFNKIVCIAGPCSVDNKKNFFKIAHFLKKYDSIILRGGIWKPRTSPYSFQGIGMNIINEIYKIKQNFKLPYITELVDPRHIDYLIDSVDGIQIGAKNMQNFELLKEVGMLKKPIILKRNPFSNIKEFLLSAEYIMKYGNENIILCERGIKTRENYSRYNLDITSIPIIKKLTKLPIIVDPSHAAGYTWLIKPLILSSIIAGADGIMLEVHNNPMKSLSDGLQSLNFNEFDEIMLKLNNLKTFLEIL